MKRLILDDPADPDFVTIDPARLVEVGQVTVEGCRRILTRRTDGPFRGKAFYLDDDFDWAFGEDGDGATCLVPLRKL